MKHALRRFSMTTALVLAIVAPAAAAQPAQIPSPPTAQKANPTPPNGPANIVFAASIGIVLGIVILLVVTTSAD